MKEDTGHIIPFCIYYRINPYTKNYLGYIAPPQKVISEDGTVSYRCAPEPQVFDQWFLAVTFYAVSPSFRPIPIGMKMFCAKRRGFFPYDTNDVSLVYDVFNVKDDCVYFITYNQKTINTTELYFHKLGTHIFPSFDEQPPSNDPNWEQTEISPIYVMTEGTVGDILQANNSLKFKCINARCLPWMNNIPDIYDNDPQQELLELDDCVLYCNELVESKTSGKPADLLQSIKSDSSRKPIVSRFFKKFPPVIIGSVILLFILILFFLVHSMVKNKTEYRDRYR